MGVTVVTLANSVNGNAFTIGDNSTYCPRITLQDFTLKGNSANNTSGNGIGGLGVERLCLNNLEITDFIEHGVLSEGASARHSVYLTVKDCYVNTNILSGIFISGDSYGALIQNNIIAGNGKTADEGGVRLNTNSDHIITGNMFDENSYAIKSYNTQYVTVTGNTFINSERDAILAYSGSSLDSYWQVTGNNIITTTPDPVYGVFRTDGTYWTVVGNTMRAVSPAFTYGFKELTGADYNTFIGNALANVTSGGIKIGANSIFHNNSGYVTENSGTVTKTADYTAVAEEFILGDATSNNVTITLPAASAAANRPFNIKKIDASANLVILAAAGADTIDGAATVSLTVQYQSLTVVSNGTSWYIL